ncbi:MAG: alkaline phosphatase family protein [Akkermansiaceae bacterium]
MPSKKRLLLVGWDSADWKLIHPLLDQDELPGVAQLVQGGVSGNLTTLEPQLSPMLWTSIATGKMAYHHGVHGFTEVDPISGRIVPVSAATRKCKTIWEMLGERGLKSHLVGWFATQGEQDLNGCMASNMYGHNGGFNLEEQSLMGHAHLETTMIYLHVMKSLEPVPPVPSISPDHLHRTPIPDSPWHVHPVC